MYFEVLRQALQQASPLSSPQEMQLLTNFIATAETSAAIQEQPQR